MSSRGCIYRSRVHKLMTHRIDFEVQPLQSPRPEQHEIARLGKHDIVAGLGTSCVDNREAGLPLYRPAVSHAEPNDFFRLNSERFQNFAGYPRRLASRVDEDVLDLK